MHMYVYTAVCFFVVRSLMLHSYIVVVVLYEYTCLLDSLWCSAKCIVSTVSQRVHVPK